MHTVNIDSMESQIENINAMLSLPAKKDSDGLYNIGHYFLEVDRIDGYPIRYALMRTASTHSIQNVFNSDNPTIFDALLKAFHIGASVGSDRTLELTKKELTKVLTKT